MHLRVQSLELKNRLSKFFSSVRDPTYTTLDLHYVHFQHERAMASFPSPSHLNFLSITYPHNQPTQKPHTRALASRDNQRAEKKACLEKPASIVRLHSEVRAKWTEERSLDQAKTKQSANCLASKAWADQTPYTAAGQAGLAAGTDCTSGCSPSSC